VRNQTAFKILNIFSFISVPPRPDQRQPFSIWGGIFPTDSNPTKDKVISVSLYVTFFKKTKQTNLQWTAYLLSKK